MSDERFSWTVSALDSVSSTMEAADDLASGALEPTVRFGTGNRPVFAVIANVQEAGRGRESRRWSSPPGRGVYASFSLGLPNIPVTGLSLVCGLAVSLACEGLGVSTKLKWPNDVLAATPSGPRKLSGVLVDLRSSGMQQRAIIGIGINVLPVEEALAVSLADLGVLADIRTTFFALCEALSSTLDKFFADGLPALLPELNRRSLLRGRRVRIDLGTEIVEGLAGELSSEGALRVSMAEGTREIYSGTVMNFGDKPEDGAAL